MVARRNHHRHQGLCLLNPLDQFDSINLSRHLQIGYEQVWQMTTAFDEAPSSVSGLERVNPLAAHLQRLGYQIEDQLFVFNDQD